MSDKRKPVCAECGSDNVWVDATASWDIGQQRWVLENTFQQEYCEKCDGETTFEWEDVEDASS